MINDHAMGDNVLMNEGGTIFILWSLRTVMGFE